MTARRTSRGGTSLKPNQHILLTGAPRSGTTFAGHIIALAGNVGYVREPFNSDFGLHGLPHQFLYLYEGMADEATYRDMAASLVAGRAAFKRMPVRGANTRRQALGRALFGSGTHYSYMKARYNPQVSRYLFKDPMACLASQYLHDQFNVQVIIMVRHPLPTIASMRRVNLDHRLDDLVAQKYLYQTYLKDILGGVRLERISSLERRALLWSCLYYMLYNFSKDHEGYIVLPHEHLAHQPQSAMQSLFGQLGLEFDSHIQEKLKTMTEHPESPGRLSGNKMHVLKRNSQKLLSENYGKFDPGELRVIHSLTDDVTKLFYSSTDWPVNPSKPKFIAHEINQASKTRPAVA